MLALLLPMLLYAPTAGFDYVHADDRDLVIANQAFLRDLGNAPRAFTQSYFEVPGDVTGVKTYYRPVTIVSFMLDAQWSGENPRSYHVTNIVLHGVSSVLLLMLAHVWGASPAAALAAALVFAAHPINVQAVAWIAGRNDLLVAVFGLLSLLAWSRCRDGGRRTTGWAGVHVLGFALALFSKETGIVLPALALIHTWLVGRDSVSRVQQIALGADAMLAMVWLTLRSTALAGAAASSPVGALGVAALNAPQLLVQLAKMLAPIRLNVSPSVDAAGIWLGAAAAILLGWLAATRLPRGPAIVAACWVGAFLLPTLFVPGLPVYEHRNYLPLAGVLVVIARAAGPLRGGAIAAVGLVIAALSVATLARQSVFRNGEMYWTDAARDSQFAPFAHVNLGQLHEQAGRLADAQREYLAALALDPDVPRAHNNLGVVAMKLGQPEAAVAYFAEEARRHPGNADAWFNLGLAADRRGDRAAARGFYERAIAENGAYRPAYEKLGKTPPRR